ncbi:MAG: hypothetical protein QQN50_01950 [Nitrosopumilus sp.]
MKPVIIIAIAVGLGAVFGISQVSWYFADQEYEKSMLELQIAFEKWNEVGCLEIVNNTEMDFEDNVDKRAFDIRWKQCLENEN